MAAPIKDELQAQLEAAQQQLAQLSGRGSGTQIPLIAPAKDKKAPSKPKDADSILSSLLKPSTSGQKLA
ncbi:UNVERIFIED_CONTAM: hypothetical protein HDU68_003428 [Siphonaria sp. JEL0065]|nr:hypothetical protein HDU68_003428 [Siphonaria sp. JEL0065]